MNELWDKYRRNSKGWQRDNIAILHPRILLGSMIHVDLVSMSMFGYTHVVNCGEPEVGSRWFKNEFSDQYVCINAIDAEDADITTWYPVFEKMMNLMLADPSCKKIYVHCRCGINRSAFLLLIYMCLKFGHSPESMISNILKQRPCALTNPTFRKQAIEYIKKHQ